MGRPVAVLQYHEDDAPGSVPALLAELGLGCRVVRVDRGEPIPPAAELTALVALGSPSSVNDGDAIVTRSLRAIEDCFARDVPVGGHCFGGQLMARALGAEVAPCPAPEIGFVEVVGVSADGWPARFTALQWHFEGFALPRGATRLWRSAGWLEQGFAYGPHLAMQFHIEGTAREVAVWTANSPELFAAPRPGVQPLAELRGMADAALAAQREVARAIYRAWLSRLVAA